MGLSKRQESREASVQAGRLGQRPGCKQRGREGQEAWTRLEARARAAGRLAGAGSRLQAERSELIWQQGGL